MECTVQAGLLPTQLALMWLQGERDPSILPDAPKPPHFLVGFLRASSAFLLCLENAMPESLVGQGGELLLSNFVTSCLHVLFAEAPGFVLKSELSSHYLSCFVGSV